jgi:hypothetical protein
MGPNYRNRLKGRANVIVWYTRYINQIHNYLSGLLKQMYALKTGNTDANSI